MRVTGVSALSSLPDIQTVSYVRLKRPLLLLLRPTMSQIFLGETFLFWWVLRTKKQVFYGQHGDSSLT